MSSRVPGRFGALVAVALVAAACSSAATPAPTAAPTAAATTAASVAPTATPLPGTKKFSIGFTSAGISSAPMMAAIDALNKDKGYQIDVVIVDSSELVTQGVASGQFAGGSGANNSSLTAVEKGANIRLVVSRVKNEWSLYAPTAVTTCAQLDGKKLALHSEGAVSTAMVKNYVNTKCPGTKPNYVIIAGSDNRVAALLANQIDASPVELGDAVTLDLKAVDRYRLLSNFGADLPDLQATSIYFNTVWMAANPGSVLDFVRAVIQTYRKVDGNATLLKEYAQKFVPNSLNKDTVDAAVKKYTDLKMFPTDGGITDKNLEYTAKFFGPAPDGTGATTKVQALSAFADTTFLKRVIAELGTK